ncbi:hypothetical protein N7470_003551 [Penicillium chermesinum]|nr:hypothetical protein N7470_003551 [Penicillium chermesinum]
MGSIPWAELRQILGDYVVQQLIPYSQVFSRHEFLLSSHLEMLGAVKNQLPHDGEASRTVASMVSKTIQSMNQFKIVRKQMMHSMSRTCPNVFRAMFSSPRFNNLAPEKSADAPSNPFSANPTPATPQSSDAEKAQKKRPRLEREAENATQPTNRELQTGDTRASKRSRSIIAHPNPPQQYPPQQYPPQPKLPEYTQRSTSPETEDISQEVQRRLRIQEERRRKKESGRSDKRKRESMGSNENASPGTAHQRKRKKVGKDSVSLKKESASSSQRKRYLDGPSSLDAAKTKKS